MSNTISHSIEGTRGVADRFYVSKGIRSVVKEGDHFLQNLEVAYSINDTSQEAIRSSRKLTPVEQKAFSLLQANKYPNQPGYSAFTLDLNRAGFSLSKREAYLLASLLDDKGGPKARNWGNIEFELPKDKESGEPWAKDLGLPNLLFKPNPGDHIIFSKDIDLRGWNCLVQGDKEAIETDGNKELKEGVLIRMASGSRFSNVTFDLTDFYDRIFCGNQPIKPTDPLPKGVGVEGDFNVLMHDGPNLFYAANAASERHDDFSTLHHFYGNFQIDMGYGDRQEKWNPKLAREPIDLDKVPENIRDAATQLLNQKLYRQRKGYFQFANDMRELNFPMDLVETYRLTSLLSESGFVDRGPQDRSWGNIISANNVAEALTAKSLLDQNEYSGVSFGYYGFCRDMQSKGFLLEGEVAYKAYQLAEQLSLNNGPSDRGWRKISTKVTNTATLGAMFMRGGKVCGNGNYDWLRVIGENLFVHGQMYLGPWKNKGTAMLIMDGGFPFAHKIYIENDYENGQGDAVSVLYLQDLEGFKTLELETDESNAFHPVHRVGDDDLPPEDSD